MLATKSPVVIYGLLVYEFINVLTLAVIIAVILARIFCSFGGHFYDIEFI